MYAMISFVSEYVVFLLYGGDEMSIEHIDDVELERYVTKIMLEIGVPAHLKGYHYLREEIMIVCRNMEIISSVTKMLYPAVARKFVTSDQKVERATRNAIEVSWIRGNVDTFQEIFGYSSETGKGRPTNSEYIARIADKIRLDYKTI